MNSTRELDLKVAELLGWTRLKEMPLGEVVMGYPNAEALAPWTALPRYSTDLAAALSLPIDPDMQYNIIVWGDGGKSVVLYDSDFFPYREDCQDGMPLAERVVRAWLAWKEASNAQGV